MSSELIALATAGMLGLLHALEIDHMLAVTTFVSRRPTLAAAVQFGLRWGVGHSIAVLAAGSLLIGTGVRWPERYDAVGEGMVGLMLIGLGIWALASARKLHLHAPQEHGGHSHLHIHGNGTHHGHKHGVGAPAHRPHSHGGVTLVGLLHGLAGTTGIVALLPVTMMDRAAIGISYLVLFGVGVTLGMMVFAIVAASAVRRATAQSLTMGRRVVSVVGSCAIVVGCWWAAAAVAG
jgi:nickel/cobalt exporter